MQKASFRWHHVWILSCFLCLPLVFAQWWARVLSRPRSARRMRWRVKALGFLEDSWLRWRTSSSSRFISEVWEEAKPLQLSGMKGKARSRSQLAKRRHGCSTKGRRCYGYCGHMPCIIESCDTTTFGRCAMTYVKVLASAREAAHYALGQLQTFAGSLHRNINKPLLPPPAPSSTPTPRSSTPSQHSTHPEPVSVFITTPTPPECAKS